MNATSNSNCASGLSSSGESACNLPTISLDHASAAKKHGIKGNYSSAKDTGYGGIHSDFNFNFVECTADSQCKVGGNSDANANTAKCNKSGGDRVTTNFPENTCIDTEKGEITIAVSVDEADRIVKVSVQDTGLGIGQVEMKHLFESFSRGKAGAKSWTKGAGMDLYIAKQFMSAHKGRIWAESSGENKGSTFFVELPLVS